MTGSRPAVIGHRGACGHRPEHTLASYELAARLGADYLEPDLAITRDGVLVCRHEPEISGTTDVADHPELASRRTTKTLDGREVTGWFVEDLTLAELKTLRARERIPRLRPANAAYDGRFDVPTLAEVAALARRMARELRRPVGLYPETKHPAELRAQGLPPEPALVAFLRDGAGDGIGGPEVPVIVQSFSADSLRELRGELDVPLILLLRARRGAAPADLAAVAAFADGIGPAKALIVPRDGEGRSLAPTSLVADAHAAGLLVHAWTFRAENAFLPLELRSSADERAHGDLAAELAQFLELGVDGVFADQPEVAVAARSTAPAGGGPPRGAERPDTP